MSKKPRKKKGNKVARDRKLAEIFTKCLAIVQLPGDNCHIVDIDDFSVVNIPPQRERDLINHQYKWTVLLCVFGRDSFGKEYFKTQEVVAPRRCYQKEIGYSMNAIHQQMYREFNKNHFISLGWIATPNDREFNLDDMFDLFKQLGAFDFLTKEENKK